MLSTAFDMTMAIVIYHTGNQNTVGQINNYMYITTIINVVL